MGACGHYPILSNSNHVLRLQRYYAKCLGCFPKDSIQHLKEKGLRSKTVKKYKATTNSKHAYPVYSNLLNQQFQVNRPGTVWKCQGKARP